MRKSFGGLSSIYIHISILSGFSPLIPAANMDWPWHINTSISLDQKMERRVLLDRYGTYAQLSALIPIAVYWLYRLGVWVFHARQRVKPWHAAIPGSPQRKEFRATKTGRVATKLRAFRFWLDGNRPGKEKRVHQLAGLAWLAWLLFLSVHRTGDGMCTHSHIPLLLVVERVLRTTCTRSFTALLALLCVSKSAPFFHLEYAPCR